MKYVTVLIILTTLLISAGCKKVPDSVDLSIKAVSASSTLADPKNRYSEFNIVDGWKAAWVAGKNGGINEKVTIMFTQSYTLETIPVYIWNGFGDEKYFALNNRVKDLDVFVKTKKVGSLLLKDTSEIQRLNVSIDESGVDEISFVIRSVYKGEIYDDTCISEIAFSPIVIPDKIKLDLSLRFQYNDDQYVTVTLSSGGVLTGALYSIEGDTPIDDGGWTQLDDGSIDVHYNYMLSRNPITGKEFNEPTTVREKYTIVRQKGKRIYTSDGRYFGLF